MRGREKIGRSRVAGEGGGQWGGGEDREDEEEER